MEELPSPIKHRDSTEETNPPSPLETEVDDEGGPSSVEAQADPSDLSFDLDLDLPTPSYPLVSPQPSTSNDILNEPTNENETSPFVDLFTPTLEPDVKVEGATAGKFKKKTLYGCSQLNRVKRVFTAKQPLLSGLFRGLRATQ